MPTRKILELRYESFNRSIRARLGVANQPQEIWEGISSQLMNHFFRLNSFVLRAKFTRLYHPFTEPFLLKNRFGGSDRLARAQRVGHDSFDQGGQHYKRHNDSRPLHSFVGFTVSLSNGVLPHSISPRSPYPPFV